MLHTLWQFIVNTIKNDGSQHPAVLGSVETKSANIFLKQNQLEKARGTGHARTIRSRGPHK